MSRQRFYIDGKFEKSVTGDIARLRRYLDNLEADWLSMGLFPLTPEGTPDDNNAHTVDRLSDDELVVVNTRGSRLRWVNTFGDW